jgi:hypothetical protein
VTDEQFLVITGLLSEIRDVLVMTLAQDDTESDECPHPDDSRISLATLARPDHWVCSLCKFENPGVIHS